MKKHIASILLFFAALYMQAADTLLIKDVFGLKPLLGVEVNECPWLNTSVFMGMTLSGDTLFIADEYIPNMNRMDMEAGENDMLREKFRESRQVMITRFLNEKRSKKTIMDGSVNKGPRNGGLVLLPGRKSGLFPEVNFSMKKSKLNYVELRDESIRKIKPWEGNKAGDYAFSPAFLNGYKRVVFVGQGNGYDLFIWDEKTGLANPFMYNSPADETYPYMYNDSIMFFSSDRIEEGNFDLFYYNFNTGKKPELFLPDALQTRDNELAIVFRRESTSLMAVENKEGITYKKVSFNLGEAPALVNVIPDSLLEAPKDDITKIHRELGRRAKEMFFVNYGERLVVARPEDVFTDSIELNRVAVKSIEKVLDKENLVDVSFLLPVELDDPEFQVENYSPDVAMATGAKRIAQLLEDIEGSSAMILGFASATGGEDMNMMRSYFQASTFSMQLTEFNEVPKGQVHILAAGEYIQAVQSDLGVKSRNNVGVVYLFKNRKVPPFLAAYKLKPTEDRDEVAQRFGISNSTLTYAELMIKPFLDVPDDVIFLPVTDITMVWSGNDLSETAREYNVSLDKLLKVNGLTKEINDKQRILYIP